MLSRRLMVKALGLAPVAAPFAAKTALGDGGLSALSTLGAVGGAVKTASIGPGIEDAAITLLRNQGRRAERLQAYLQSLRINGLDSDIAGMRSWSPAYRTLRQFERDTAVVTWFDELRDKVGWL